MEQCANKLCYKLGKIATETRKMLVQVYGREAVSRKCVYTFAKGRKQLRMSHIQVSHRQAEPQKWSRKRDKCWQKKVASKGVRFADVNAIKDLWQLFCDRFHRRSLLIVSGSFTNVVKRVVANGNYLEAQWRKFVCICCFVYFLIGFTKLFRHTMYA